MTDTTTIEQKAYDRLTSSGIRPSAPRMAIMQYLLTHFTHPTVEDVYEGIHTDMPSLSKTTVYNSLRLFSDRHAAQMITIDDHRVCYDGDIKPHVHFFCKKCGKVFDLFGEEAPKLDKPFKLEGHLVTEKQLYYKGYCRNCAKDAEA